MYSVMFRVMFYDMWTNLKKQKADAAFWVIWFLFLLSDNVWEAVRNQNGSIVENKELRLIFFLILLMCTLGMWLKYLPLRICRTAYLCPMNEKERLRYLGVLLLVKIAVWFVEVLLVTKASFGKIILTEHIGLHVIQMLLYAATFWYFEMLVGINRLENKKIDKKGYLVVSKEEQFFKNGYTALLIIEWTYFVLCFLKVCDAGMFPYTLLWVLLGACNIGIMVKCTKPMLLEMACYEKAYCMKPKEESVLYDI